MKRFLAFAGERFYPKGGWEDFRGSFDSLEDAKSGISPTPDDEWGWWGQVFDTQSSVLHSCDEIGDEWRIEPSDVLSDVLT